MIEELDPFCFEQVSGNLDLDEIEDCARHYLPADAPYFGKSPGVNTPEAERLAICLHDPKLGWNFVKSFIQARKQLPIDLVVISLSRAYAYLMVGEYDPPVVDAIALTHPKNTAQCNLLKGLIMSRDISLPGIARWMRIPTDTLKLFCELFFNVRNCWHLPGYMVNLLYPKSRDETYREEDYLEHADPCLLLMRMGYHYGANKVAEFAGLNPNGNTKMGTAELCDEFESMVIKNGVSLAHLGYLNAKNYPGIAHAKSVLAAKRKAQEKSNQVADDVMGLGALSAGPSMGQGIMDVVKALQSKDVEARRELQQQKFEQDARKEKAAKAEQ